MTREQELEFLKTESQALREELKELEDRIGQLSAGRK
jgi:prefoldin subunit 5